MKRKKKIEMMEPEALAKLLDPWFERAQRAKVDRHGDFQRVVTNICGNFWNAIQEHRIVIARVGAYSVKLKSIGDGISRTQISGYVDRYGKNPTGEECVRFVFHEDYWFKIFPGRLAERTNLYYNGYIRSDINIETYIPGRS